MSPIGTKIFAEAFNIDRFVGGNDLAYSITSLTPNSNLSVSVFQLHPKIVTGTLLLLYCRESMFSSPLLSGLMFVCDVRDSVSTLILSFKTFNVIKPKEP